MKLSLRVDDETGRRIAATSVAEGLTRSRWIERLIEQKLAAPTTVPTTPKRVRGERVKIHLRVDAPIADAIDLVAHQAGMRRNQWIDLVLYNQLFGEGDELIFPPITADGFSDVVMQLVRIGQNINNAVRTMNTAALVHNNDDLTEAAERLVSMKQNLQEQLEGTWKTLLEMASAERHYWRDDT